MKAGEPDCIIYHNGKVLFIELKVWKGTLKPEQRDRHRKLESVGCPVHMVIAKTPQYAVAQVEKILKDAKII